MHSFDTTLDKGTNGRVVRWPFRILAAVFLSALLVALFGAIYRWESTGDLKSGVMAVAALPLAILVGRLAGHAILKGRILRNPFWPFASGVVTLCWIVLFLSLVMHYSPI